MPMVIKIVDKNTPDKVAQAIGELKGAGFNVSYQEETDFLGIDATKNGDGEQTYGASYVIVGKKI